jgi:hypothetical protein
MPMSNLSRRSFLQVGSLFVAGSYVRPLWGQAAAAAPEQPKFAGESTFEPTATFLTWQRDPTTTMTVQWIGAEKDAENLSADRPLDLPR